MMLVIIMRPLLSCFLFELFFGFLSGSTCFSRLDLSGHFTPKTHQLGIIPRSNTIFSISLRRKLRLSCPQQGWPDDAGAAAAGYSLRCCRGMPRAALQMQHYHEP
jgi:hypothetical protein